MTDFSNTERPSTQDVKDKVADLGKEVRQRAGDAFDASAGLAKEKLSELTGVAKDVASQAADKVSKEVGAQQAVGADFIGRFAENIRNSAKAFEQDAPFAAKGIDMAATYVDDAATMIRNGSVRDLVDGATSFARRQPAAFLGLSVLAGFAAVRFLKAGSEGVAGGQGYGSVGSSGNTTGTLGSPQGTHQRSTYNSGAGRPYGDAGE